jgi:arylsulfatase A-like enzyme
VNENDTVGEDGVPITDDVTRVPFLIMAPRLAPAESDVDYQHVDFEATIRDLLGAEPNGSAGVSAFAAERPDRARVFYVDQKNDRYWKYVRDEASGNWDLDEYVIGQMPEAPEAFASLLD